MEKYTTEAALQEAILLLEMKQAEKAKHLMEDIHDIYEKLKPVNIVKSILSETVKSPGIRHIAINKTVDVALVFLTNIILRKTTNSFVKKTIGTALVLGVKNIVARNPEIVKKAGTGILKMLSNIFTKRNKTKNTDTSHVYR